MATEILMPKLGLTMTEGLIQKWLVQVGDTVTSGQPLLEISSEKLTSEVESPASGVVLDIVHGEGVTVKCKEVVGWVGQEGEDVGTQEAPAQEEAPTEVAKDSTPSSPKSTTAPIARTSGERIFITPVARKMAAEKGYDISLIKGTGGNGRITRRDVEAYQPSLVADKVVEPLPQAMTSVQYGEGLQGMRKIIAERMMNSLHSSAQVTLHRKADLTELLKFRKELKAKVHTPLENGELGITTLLTKAVTKALRDFPALNAWYGGGIHQIQERIHIGMATALDDGLVVPVIQDADRMTLADLGQSIKTLANQARKGTLPSDLYSGSTFSITNLGGPGVEYFTPILNSPEVAILGVGATQQALAFNEEGEVVQKDYLPLSLSFDHQVIDGLPAAEFLAQVISYLEDPYLLIF